MINAGYKNMSHYNLLGIFKKLHLSLYSFYIPMSKYSFTGNIIKTSARVH